MFFRKLGIAITFTAYHVFIVGAALAPLYPKMSKLEWHHNIKYLNVTLRESACNQSYVFEMIAMRDISNMRLNVDYAVRAFNGTIQNTIYSRSMELCQFMKRPNMDRLMKIFYDAINKTSNLPTRCPIPKAELASLNFVPSSMPVPGFFPEADFLSNVNVYTGLRHEPMFQSRWYGRLSRT